jgi:hypothetical protein
MYRAALLFLVILAGCADQPAREVGRLNLLAPLTVPAERATARLQYGHVVPSSEVRDYDPYCVFELNTVGDGPQTVAPDTFSITRISQRIDNIATSEARLFNVVLSDGSLPTLIYYKTLMTLHSPRQPRVRMLTCLSNQNMPGVYPFMRHLTLEGMRAALGADFRLALN